MKLGSDRNATEDALSDCGSRRCRQSAQVEMGQVAGAEHAAQHRDAERASRLVDGLENRRADTAFVLGQLDQGGGHGGSHPHLANEFIMSIIEGRPSFPDVYQSVNWTCAGICAHESAMRGGEIVHLPDFRS